MQSISFMKTSDKIQYNAPSEVFTQQWFCSTKEAIRRLFHVHRNCSLPAFLHCRFSFCVSVLMEYHTLLFIWASTASSFLLNKFHTCLLLALFCFPLINVVVQAPFVVQTIFGICRLLQIFLQLGAPVALGEASMMERFFEICTLHYATVIF